MSDEKFPLPGSSYKELSKIIDAYSNISGPTAPGPVGQLAVVHETVVSRNNKFLVAAGLIEGGQKKSCTALGTRLGRAIQHEQDEAIASAWKTVVEQTDFFQKIISAIRIRKGMEESALASHIAFTAGSAKNAYARAGAGAIIEILRWSGAVTADGGTLVATNNGDITTPADLSSEPAWNPFLTNKEPSTMLLRADSVPARREFSAREQSATSPAVALRINLSISCAPAELEGLGAKLRKLKEEFEGSRDNTSVEVTVKQPVDLSSVSTEESPVTDEDQRNHDGE